MALKNIKDNSILPILRDKYKEVDFNDLPLPVSGVPLTIGEYGYKTYYIERHNQNFQQNLDKTKPKAIVYLITDGDNFKIGMTKCLKDRLSTLQTSSAKDLEVLDTYKPTNISATKLEDLLHNHYSGFKIRGEWFSKGIDVSKFKDVCKLYDKET